MTDPTNIYLEPDDGLDRQWPEEGRTWAPDDPWGNGVKYVRSDQYDQLLNALKAITRFGAANPGCGYTCAEIANEAIKHAYDQS